MNERAHGGHPVDGKNAAHPEIDEFLTFTLGGEEFGVDILKVQEIRGYDAVTHIPDTPPYVKGVIDLRGTIVPVIDMRLKFKLPDAAYDAFTVMIILNVGRRVVGVVVDGVSDVVGLRTEQVRPPPALGRAPGSEFVTGVGTLEGRLVILVDIEKAIGPAELGLLDASQARAA